MARLQLALTVRTSNPVPADQPNLASWSLVWSQFNRNIFLRGPWRPAPISGPIEFRRKNLLFSIFLYSCLLFSTFCCFASSVCLAACLPLVTVAYLIPPYSEARRPQPVALGGPAFTPTTWYQVIHRAISYSCT